MGKVIGYSPRVPKDSYCGNCGAPYGPATGWPRTCPACGDIAYRNPLPVAVTLLPVRDADGTGLVVITRTVEPRRGGIALPGGFIDFGEDWQHAVVRELKEETGIEAARDEVRLADAMSAPGRPSAAVRPAAGAGGGGPPAVAGDRRDRGLASAAHPGGAGFPAAHGGGEELVRRRLRLIVCSG